MIVQLVVSVRTEMRRNLARQEPIARRVLSILVYARQELKIYKTNNPYQQLVKLVPMALTAGRLSTYKLIKFATPATTAIRVLRRVKRINAQLVVSVPMVRKLSVLLENTKAKKPRILV